MYCNWTVAPTLSNERKSMQQRRASRAKEKPHPGAQHRSSSVKSTHTWYEGSHVVKLKALLWGSDVTGINPMERHWLVSFIFLLVSGQCHLCTPFCLVQLVGLSSCFPSALQIWGGTTVGKELGRCHPQFVLWNSNWNWLKPSRESIVQFTIAGQNCHTQLWRQVSPVGLSSWSC